MNAFDLLNAATYADKVTSIIKSATRKILSSWREKDPSKNDDEILRSKLVECGWKYSRQRGRWIHPKVEEFRAPKTLNQLAEMMARSVLGGTIRKMQDEGANG